MTWHKLEITDQGSIVSRTHGSMDAEQAEQNRETFVFGEDGWQLWVNLSDLVIGRHQKNGRLWVQWWTPQ